MTEIAEQPKQLPSTRRKTYEGLLADIIIALAAYPQEVEVYQLANGKCLHLEITAHRDDHGRIIGKKGATIGAMHKLFVSINRGCPVKIDIKDLDE